MEEMSTSSRIEPLQRLSAVESAAKHPHSHPIVLDQTEEWELNEDTDLALSTNNLQDQPSPSSHEALPSPTASPFLPPPPPSKPVAKLNAKSMQARLASLLTSEAHLQAFTADDSTDDSPPPPSEDHLQALTTTLADDSPPPPSPADIFQTEPLSPSRSVTNSVTNSFRARGAASGSVKAPSVKAEDVRTRTRWGGFTLDNTPGPSRGAQPAHKPSHVSLSASTPAPLRSIKSLSRPLHSPTLHSAPPPAPPPPHPPRTSKNVPQYRTSTGAPSPRPSSATPSPCPSAAITSPRTASVIPSPRTSSAGLPSRPSTAIPSPRTLSVIPSPRNSSAASSPSVSSNALSKSTFVQKTKLVPKPASAPPTTRNLPSSDLAATQSHVSLPPLTIEEEVEEVEEVEEEVNDLPRAYCQSVDEVGEESIDEIEDSPSLPSALVLDVQQVAEEEPIQADEVESDPKEDNEVVQEDEEGIEFGFGAKEEEEEEEEEEEKEEEDEEKGLELGKEEEGKEEEEEKEEKEEEDDLPLDGLSSHPPWGKGSENGSVEEQVEESQASDPAWVDMCACDHEDRHSHEPPLSFTSEPQGLFFTKESSSTSLCTSETVASSSIAWLTQRMTPTEDIPVTRPSVMSRVMSAVSFSRRSSKVVHSARSESGTTGNPVSVLYSNPAARNLEPDIEDLERPYH